MKQRNRASMSNADSVTERAKKSSGSASKTDPATRRSQNQQHSNSTVQSNSAVQSNSVKTPSAKPLLRFDGPHRASRQNDHFISDDERQTRVSDRNALSQGPPIKSLKHTIIFGLLVFLIGQAILVWAFLAGHFPAWSIGNLISLAGVSISILSVAQTLGVVERKIDWISGNLPNMSSNARQKTKTANGSNAKRNRDTTYD